MIASLHGDNIIGLVLSVLLIGFLVAALLFPERF
ncbi:MAG TPA: K(+)-transporting ATPase subunit F [Ilumatobacteraceae bacterium]